MCPRIGTLLVCQQHSTRNIAKANANIYTKVTYILYRNLYEFVSTFSSFHLVGILFCSMTSNRIDLFVILCYVRFAQKSNLMVQSASGGTAAAVPRPPFGFRNFVFFFCLHNIEFSIGL